MLGRRNGLLEQLLRLLAECRSRFPSPFRFRADYGPSGERRDKPVWASLYLLACRLFSRSSVAQGLSAPLGSIGIRNLQKSP
jgi:hypothetical protein